MLMLRSFTRSSLLYARILMMLVVMTNETSIKTTRLLIKIKLDVTVTSREERENLVYLKQKDLRKHLLHKFIKSNYNTEDYA